MCWAGAAGAPAHRLPAVLLRNGTHITGSTELHPIRTVVSLLYQLATYLHMRCISASKSQAIHVQQASCRCIAPQPWPTILVQVQLDKLHCCAALQLAGAAQNVRYSRTAMVERRGSKVLAACIHTRPRARDMVCLRCSLHMLTCVATGYSYTCQHTSTGR